MIITKNKTIKDIIEADATKTAVFASKDSVYDKEKQEFKFNTKFISGNDFRLIHDGDDTISIIEGSEKTYTETIYNIEEFKTEQDCLDQIKTLGLIHISVEIETEKVT